MMIKSAQIMQAKSLAKTNIKSIILLNMMRCTS